MTGDIGNFALGLAILAAAVAVLLCVAAARFDSDRLLRGAHWMIGILAAMLSVSVAALTVAMLKSDFAIDYVARYTERALPVGYKLAAVWAGQEGSILLWGWLLAVLSVIFVVSRRDLRGIEGSAVTATVAVACGFFAIVLLFAANPFKLGEAVPADGHGLNPLLQDPAMIAHPPVLFLGYAGYTMPFALLIGALAAGRKDNQWIAATRRWVIASWLFLTAGIVLGAQWAYIELGWGGYWAWDPVENASLLPWLTGTALLHSIMAQQHRGMFKKWNAALIVLSFALCIFGTYLTRSGVIQSVHAFGESLIGLFFLAFMIVALVVSVLLMAMRWRELREEQEITALISRESVFFATNILLVGMMLITLIGTIFPIISRLMSGKEVTVGQAFYNKVVGPMGMALVGLMAIGPMLVYGDGATKRLVRGVAGPAILAIGAIGGGMWLGLRDGWSLAAVGIVALGVACIVVDLGKSIIGRVRDGANPFSAILHLIDGNHRRYGGQLAHVGMLMVIAGMVGSSVFGQKNQFELKPGQSADFAGHKLTYIAMHETRHANYTAVQAEMTVTAADGTVTTLRPQRRFYDKSEQPNSEVGLSSDWRRDVYLTLGGWEKGGQIVAVQAIINPLVSWIWIGGLVMCVGAVFCMLPRLIPQAEAVPATRQPSPARGRLALTGAK